MKKSLPLCTLLSVMLLSAFSLQRAYSQPLLVENFDYTAGTVLTAVGWTAHSGAADDAIDVVVPGLSFTGYPLSNIGGAALLDNNGEDINKTFDSQTAGAIFVAAMVQVDAFSPGYFLHLGQTTVGTTLFARVGIAAGSTGTSFKFTLSKGSETAVQSSSEYNLGSTYLVVAKYNIIDGTTNDEVSLFIIDGSIPTDEPATATIPAFTTTGADYSPGAIALRQYNDAQDIKVDGIRIAKTWADAVTAAFSTVDNAPPVFSAGFPKVANIDATQADLQVSMDEAGKAYYVIVPDGATAPTAAEVVARTNYGTVTLVANGAIDVIAGGATYTATITSLTDKTNYDIYFVAEDDEATPNRQTDPVKVDLYTIRPPDVLLGADFETASSITPFTQVSITGDQVWAQATYSGNGFAKISGYSGGAKENEDWLISPSVNLASAETVKLSFLSAMDFTGGSFKVMISSNFSGTYTATDIAAATWTDITSNFALSTDNYVWVPSGEFSLAGYSGNIYVAFVYTSTATEAATWEVDDVKITGYLIPGSDATLADLSVDGATVPSFDPGTLAYEMVLEASVTTPPVVLAITTDPSASIFIDNATNLAGDVTARTTKVVVTAADGVTTQTYSILFNPIITVANLGALRAVLPENYNRLYQVTGEVIISGINDSQRHQKYIQDATAGVLIDDNDAKITTAYNVGDGIKGLTGTLTEYAKLLEFVPYRDPGTASSTGNALTPQVVTITEFNTNQENYESELVKIVGVKFTDGNGTAAFQEKKNYNISVGTDVTILRTIFLSTDLTGKIIPYMADVTGIATVYNTDAQLAPRNYADLVIYSSDAALSDIKVNGTTVTGFAAGTLAYNVSLPAGTTAIPTVTATPAESNASVVITAATSLTGDAAARTAKIDVTSQDKSTVKNYTVVFSVATGIDENLNNRLKIYPVPARTEITAEGLDGITMIEIYEVTGKKVASIRCEEDSTKVIPVASLRRGLYFMKFISPKGVIMEKFIKE